MRQHWLHTTKALVASARAAHVSCTAERLGVRVSDVHVDFAPIIARKDAMVQRWRAGVACCSSC